CVLLYFLLRGARCEAHPSGIRRGHEPLYIVKIIWEALRSQESARPGGTVATTARWTADELAAFQAGLTPQSLSAIMRSSWTWDDRALRRDLSRLLTGLTAVRELDPGGDVHRVVRGRTLQ